MLRLSWVSSLRRLRAPTRTRSVAMARKKQLRAAGIEEDAVGRRDKAELVGYIARLESEINDHQHNLEVVLLERKELTSKYQQLVASSEFFLAEARKRETNLERNLAIQKERVSNLERALHDMRGDTAEALRMIEKAQKMLEEAKAKLCAAKFLEAEYASKEKEINLLRKSLDDTRNKLHEKEQSLLKEQILLNQRDENILERLGYVTRSEKRLEEEKLNLEDERKVLLEEKYKLDLNMQATISREEAIIQKESILDKRESELLVLQETIASKEKAEIDRLYQQEVALVRRQEFDTEMDIKLASFEEEIDARKTLLDQRETAINEQEDSVAQREQNLNLRLAELANKEESLVKKLKNGGVENLKENYIHMSLDEDKNSGPKHSVVKKLELSHVSTPIFWVRKCAQVIFKCSPKKIADSHNDGLVPTKLANVNDSSLAAAYSDGHRLENDSGEVPQTEDGLKVGKKRLNNVLSHGDSEILQPKRKQQRSTTQTIRVIGGEIDANCPSVLEEKCSKNEHDAVPGLCGKGSHNPQEGKLASSCDVPEGDKHSEDISVSAAEPSNGHCMVDSEDKDEPNEDPNDEDDEEEKTSSAKKIWRFLIT